jgi:subtilase family serine protease
MCKTAKLLVISLGVFLLLNAGIWAIQAPPPDQADLSITSLTYSPPTPDDFDAITITVTVKNKKNNSLTASNFYVEIKIDDEATPFRQLIASLAPDATTQIQRTGVVLPPGAHTVLATVDVTNVVAESNEGNNTQQTTINVTPAPPDLIVESLTHSPQNPVTDETVTITAVVKNIGTQDADPSILEILLSNESTPTTHTVPLIVKDGTFQVQRQVVFNLDGDYDVTATADANGDVAESDETNNTNTDSITVVPPEGPDLIVTLDHAPADPTIDDAITVTAVVENIGDDEADTSTLELDFGGLDGIETFEIPPLEADESFQVERQLTPNAAGAYQVGATADLNDDVEEGREGNNTDSDDIQVTAPDLVVSALNHAPADPTNIDNVTITAIVENIGDAASTTSTLELDVDGNITTYEVPPLDPTDTFQAQPQVLFGTPGSYPVNATADLYDDVNESDEGNNTASDTIDVIEAPDLIVSSLDHSPADPFTNEIVTITAEVKNIGDIAATTTTLEIDVDGVVTTHEIPILAPSETHQAQRQVIFPNAGNYPVTATADVLDEEAESNETNNDANDEIVVVEPPKPDLVVDSIDHSPEYPFINDTITLTAIVKNIGEETATTSVLELDVEGESGPTTFTIPILAPDESSEVQLQVIKTAGGTYQVTGTADLDDDNEESDEGNNVTIYEFTVREPGPDLIVDSLTHTPVDPTLLDPVTVIAVVKNVGDAAATTTTLEINVESDVTTYTIPILDPMESFEVQRPLVPLALGAYNVEADADVDDYAAESIEDNNTALDSFTVVEPPKPDLVINTLSFNPTSPNTDDLVTITVIVENIGNANAITSTLEIDIDGTPVTYPVPALNIGNTHQILHQQNFPTTGTYNITATADIDDDVDESNEGNNSASDSLIVVKAPRPDLVISSLNYIPAMAFTSQIITITAQVENVGNAEATTSTLWILVGAELDPESYEIGPLAPAETRQAQRQLEFTDPGSYLVTATADAEEDVDESDETNNSDTIDIIVYNSDIVKLREYLLGLITLTEEEEPYYDINQDGIVDIADLISLIVQ